jgi:hypothetical protein
MKERAMPDFTTVSVEDAKVQTASGRQRSYMNEYAGYIQQLSAGKAGMLHPKEDEKSTTIRRRLVVAAQTLGITLVIKRSGEDIYFWSEGRAAAQPRPRNGRRRRRQEETAEQYFREPEEFDRRETEDSPELGQTQ